MIYRMPSLVCPLLVCLSLLTACATTAPGQPPAPVERSEPASIPRPETPPEPFVGPPASAPAPVIVPAPAPAEPAPATPASTLMASVDEAVASGDLERAAALADRALRISPRDPLLWYQRARISYQQQRYNEASGFARRALSFAGSDAGLVRDINLLLELTNR
jgi:hypothetical protein